MKKNLLTETELELMQLLWKLEGGQVADVIAQLPPERELAYTSVSTILRILEQKGFLRAEKVGRGHRYIPLIEKHDYEARTVHDIVDRVFEGAPMALARQLLSTTDLDRKELDELKAMIEKLEKRA